ncbi:MAG: PD-(D/E)XK nuclease family protein [Oscillospiraceae bacterium]|nr:PD-(D/E)XK nuclease family protein [Oscillospiraceae bacterium]
MLKFITGGAGTGKSYEMMNRINTAVSQKKQVLAIVPDQFNFEYNRLLYNFIGMEGFNEMEIVSFSRLAQYIFLKCGGEKGSYADDVTKNIIMSKAVLNLVRENSLSYYRKQAKRRSFANDALEFVRTFGINNISAETLALSSETLGGNLGDKIKDISLILTEYSRLLKESGFKDGSTDISLAAEKAARSGFFEGRRIFIDEFKSFTPDELDMLRAMISGAEECTLCLTTENTVLTEGSVFEVSDRTIDLLKNFAGGCERTHLTENRRFKAPDIAFHSKNTLRSVREKFTEKANAVKIYKAESCYDEADFIGAEISRLVSECGYACSEIAVAARNKEDYSTVMEAAFERYDIPLYSDEKQSAAHHALIVFVKTAVKLAAAKKFSTEDMLRYAKTGFAGLSYDRINLIEEYCYKWSIDGKLWLSPFAADKDDGAAEEARLGLVSPLLKLKKRLSGGTAEDYCRAISDFLDETKAASHIHDMVSAAENAPSETAADALVLKRRLKQLWEALCGTLQSLYRTLGQDELSVREFADIFDTAISGIKLSAPPQTTNAVHFNAIHLARFSNPRVLFIAGANEGVFPYAAKASHLLTDKDILDLKEAGIAVSGCAAEKTSEERFAVYNAVSAPSELLYMSYPLYEISGKPLYPSTVLKQTAAMLEGSDIILSKEKLGVLYFCRNGKSGYYQYVQNLRNSTEDTVSLEKVLSDLYPENKARFERLKALGGGISHSLSEDTARRLFGSDIRLSASRFEDYQKCPFMYLCKSGLKLYPRQKIEYNPISRGNIIHYCMEQVLSRFGDDFKSTEDKLIAEAVKKAFKEYYADEMGGEYAKTERFKAAYSRLEQTALRLLMRLKQEFANSAFSPKDFEYTLSDFMPSPDSPLASKTSDEPALKLDLDGGGKVVFNGSIDRVDTANIDGNDYVRVIDYKTGSKDFNLTEVAHGLDMQMLLYLFAITDKNSSEGKYHSSAPAGVLYMPSRDASLSSDFKSAPSDEEHNAIVNDSLRMKGLVVKDGDNCDILKAMDSSVEEKAKTAAADSEADFIPVSIKKDKNSAAGGTVQDKNTITPDDLEILRSFCYSMLAKAAENIRSGSFEAKPLTTVTMNGVKPCCYCDYRSVCGNYPSLEKTAPRLSAKEAKAKIFDKN